MNLIINKRRKLDDYTSLYNVDAIVNEFFSIKYFRNLIKEYNDSLLIHFGNVYDLNNHLSDFYSESSLQLSFSKLYLIEPIIINKNILGDNLIYNVINMMKNTDSNFVGIVNAKPIGKNNINQEILLN